MNGKRKQAPSRPWSASSSSRPTGKTSSATPRNPRPLAALRNARRVDAKPDPTQDDSTALSSKRAPRSPASPILRYRHNSAPANHTPASSFRRHCSAARYTAGDSSASFGRSTYPSGRPVMRYIVCYDISDDRRRQQLADLMLDYGSRVEESVFECTLEAQLAAGMTERIRKVVDTERTRCWSTACVMPARKKRWSSAPSSGPKMPSFTFCERRTCRKRMTICSGSLQAPGIDFCSIFCPKALKMLELVAFLPVDHSVHEVCSERIVL